MDSLLQFFDSVGEYIYIYPENVIAAIFLCCIAAIILAKVIYHLKNIGNTDLDITEIIMSLTSEIEFVSAIYAEISKSIKDYNLNGCKSYAEFKEYMIQQLKEKTKEFLNLIMYANEKELTAKMPTSVIMPALVKAILVEHYTAIEASGKIDEFIDKFFDAVYDEDVEEEIEARYDELMNAVELSAEDYEKQVAAENAAFENGTAEVPEYEEDLEEYAAENETTENKELYEEEPIVPEDEITEPLDES